MPTSRRARVGVRIGQDVWLEEVERLRGGSPARVAAERERARLKLAPGMDQLIRAGEGGLDLLAGRQPLGYGFEPMIHVERAELARQNGDHDECEQQLLEAHRPFTKIGATGHAEKLAARLPAVA